MVLDYLDITAFIEHVREEALSQGIILKTVDDILDFLGENPDGYINVIKRS